MKFSQLDLSIQLSKALSHMQYSELTEIQEKVIPKLLRNESVVAQSMTGSGKTLAYAVPLLQKITIEERHPQALILVPTRELALQTKKTLDALGLYLHTRHLLLVGKQSFHFQKEDMKQRTHIIIATPGRLLQHIQEHTVDLSHLSTLVLDEADEILRLGFRQTLDKIFPHLPSGMQSACFSATFPKEVHSFLHERFSRSLWIKSDAPVLPQGLKQIFIRTVAEHRYELLLDALCSYSIKRCMIFVNTIEEAERLHQKLLDQNLLSTTLHGNQTQEERFSSLQSFRDGKTRLMVASNVAARGLDIPDVSLIVNYDFPLKKESYIHRIGRSARMEQSGLALSFVIKGRTAVFDELKETFPSFSLIEPQFSCQYSLQRLQQPLEQTLSREQLIRQDVMKLCIFAGKSKKLRAGDLVGAICSIEGIDGDDIGVIQIQDHNSYVEILNGKGELVLTKLNQRTIKNKRIRVEKAHEC